MVKLQLSDFMANPRCSKEHKKLIIECAKIFIRRMPGIQLSEILETPEHLTMVLREEAVEKWTMHEVLAEEVNRLKETQAA